MFFWHIIVKHLSKKRSWCLYSLISIVTFSLFLLCHKGSFTLLIVLCVLNGIPAGGAYLNEVFVSDAIDYDEFITGKRNEGLYTVFSSFIPKFVSIIAQSIPLTILGIIGFTSGRNGESINQPQSIKEFIRFVNYFKS
jgi:glycoside/pentoside/hexuronide:cation symporter, GPH family